MTVKAPPGRHLIDTSSDIPGTGLPEPFPGPANVTVWIPASRLVSTPVPPTRKIFYCGFHPLCHLPWDFSLLVAGDHDQRRPDSAPPRRFEGQGPRQEQRGVTDHALH